MTTATYIADLEQPIEELDWYQSVSNIVLIDPFDTARFKADNGDYFDVHLANNVHAGTSPPHWVVSDIEVPNSTWIQVPYESVEPIQEIKEYTQKERLIGLDVENLVGSFSKCFVVTATVPKRLPAELNATFVSARDTVEESSMLDRAGLQKSSSYFHSGTHREHYKQRITDLRQDGELDNISINSDSQSAFWQLLDKIPDSKRAEIVLLDNGNLRTYWRNEIREYVGLELINDQSLRCLIHQRMQSGEFDTTVVSSLAISEMVEAIDAFGMLHILNS